jgi:hypothetical protein
MLQKELILQCSVAQDGNTCLTEYQNVGNAMDRNFTFSDESDERSISSSSSVVLNSKGA